MLYGDLGRFPLIICIKKRIIGFWYKLIITVPCSLLHVYPSHNLIAISIKVSFL